MWRFQHPSGAREIDALHVPAHTNIRLAMTSQDVIHDLYLPALRLKQDILPDRYTYEWFNATKTGIFHFTCAEFCGTDHSIMAGSLVIMTPEDYARWTAAQPEGDDLAHQGKALFHSLGCSGCHTPGSSVHAPDLRGVYGHVVHLSDGSTRTADEAYLRDCMLLPDTHPCRRLSADHAEFHRLGGRRPDRRARGLHQIVDHGSDAERRTIAEEAPQ